MIITNSTADEYYFDQLIAFLMSIKINSPKHLGIVKVFLANYPEDLQKKLERTFPEVSFENNQLKMIDKRGFSMIIDRAIRIGECLDKYKEPVAWIDTDVLVRGDISEFLEIESKQLKILYRKNAPYHVKINAGVFNIGYSKETHSFINSWYQAIKVNKKWGQGQLEFWRVFRTYRKRIKMVELPMKFNSIGHFNDEYIIWHCKKGHFEREKYQVEYQKYLALAKEHMEVVNMDRSNYAEFNAKITKHLLSTQSQAEKEKIMKKRHLPILDIISKYANKDLPLLDIGSREGNLLKLLSKAGFKDIYGVDISEDAINILKSRGFNGEVIDAQNLNLNKSYNTIIVSHMLEHCPDMNKVISNVYNHLVDNGILYVEVPRQPKIEMPTKAGHYYHFDGLREFLSFFEESKWKVLYTIYERGENKGRIKVLFRKLNGK